MLALVLGAAGAAFASDARVTAPQWTDPKDPPDELPRFKAEPKIRVPAELKAATDINYVILESTLDPKGRRLGVQRYVTVPMLERFIESQLDEMRFTPGKREGKPVNTAITNAVIFNPATSAENQPDASPRLLEVTKVVLPRPATAKRSDRFPPQIVLANVRVNEVGEVVDVNDAPAEVAEQMKIATKNWRFAPARQGGQPVAADVRMPFVVTWRGEQEVAGQSIPPRVIEQVKPDYPVLMRASGLKGEVVVDFVVDIEGRVRNAYVVRSLNPAFDDLALDAVRKWRFEPGRVGERPVRTHMRVPVIFQLQGVYDGGSNGLEVTRKADLAKLPEELRYDTPPRIIGVERPVYPYAQLAARTEGRATVAYVIDERGRIEQTKVMEATDPAFGEALVAAVERFRYEPASKKGRPIKSLGSFTQEFRRDAAYQLVSDIDLWLLTREGKNPQSIVTLRDLDAKLAPLSRKPPRFPLGETERAQGEALIEFIVDDEGRARLPRVVSATSAGFGQAAAVAVATWRFEPPTKAGRGTQVRVQVPVNFSRGDAAGDAAAK